MRDQRQGTDVNIKWAIVANDAPFNLEGKDVKVYLKNIYRKTEVKDFSVEGNKLLWTFYGKDQKHTGKYSLELVINEGAVGMATTDKCDFINLVDCSCKIANKTDDSNVEIDTIELTSTIEYGTQSVSIEVDSGLSATSENPVQNKVITAKLTELSAQVGEVSTAVNGKQDKIDDLDSIRSGAAKGATALQSVPDTYATKTYVDEKLAQSGGQGGGEPSQYIKEATTSADGNTLTLIKKDNTQVVFSPSGGGGESSGSNEWKCVFEGRPAVGTKNWEFRTFSDGTSLKATEVIIQVLCDKTSTENATGYVQINSTLNKTLTAYGVIGLEATNAKEAEPVLQEMRLKASPCFMTAEISTSIKATAGQTVYVQRNGGHLKTFEIYEDIVYVKVYTTGVVSENVGLLKIYAR